MRMIAAASLATCVPETPIANPTSAFFKAGASLVPSPVTATTCFLSMSPVTRAYLSSGLDLARTERWGTIWSNLSPLRTVSTRISQFFSFASFLFLGQSQSSVLHFLQTIPPISLMNSTPSMTMSFYLKMLHSIAMALAVILLSPVTILTLIPACSHWRTAPGTSFLTMSLMPKMQSRVSPDYSMSWTPFLSLETKSLPSEMFL